MWSAELDASGQHTSLEAEMPYVENVAPFDSQLVHIPSQTDLPSEDSAEKSRRFEDIMSDLLSQTTSMGQDHNGGESNYNPSLSVTQYLDADQVVDAINWDAFAFSEN
jgi:hypothetical protein